MQDVLAINGGRRAMDAMVRYSVPSWPPIYPETAEVLKQIYLSGRWSFNEVYEQRFSQAFAQYHHAGHGVYMVNGTVTLEAALRALGVGEGDEVLIPGLTWMATAMSAVYVGAKPVFVDIEPTTLCLDAEKVKQAITRKTKAMIPVHLYGGMADLEALLELGNKHGVAVVEDCAHAHGGVWNSRGVGSWGAAGSFSMQQSKTLCSGEGGMVITNDADLAGTMFRYKHIGYDFSSKQGQAGSGPPEGLACHNYRGTEFEAAILLGGLKYLPEQTRRRDENAGYLRELLADVPGVTIQSRGRLADWQGYYALVFMFDLAEYNHVSLGRLAEILQAEGLGVGKTYGPVYDHLLWSVPESGYGMAKGGCPVADEVCANSALTLMHQWLLGSRELIEAIAAVIKKVAGVRKTLS